MPKGITLPEPNTDPNYVPTPPVATLGEISPRGIAEIKFSEDVFIYEDLQSMQVPRQKVLR